MLALALWPACGQTSPPQVEVTSQAVVAGGGARTVTLITGDRVSLAPDGGPGAVHVQPGPGRDHIGFVTHRVGDETIVIPHDVAELVASGQLDRSLFSITRLLAEHYDDAQRDDLPLIVTGQPDVSTAQRRLATTALRVDRVMPALHAMAVRQRKTATSALLDELRTQPSQQIWLDRRFQVALDHSVPQIGAPVAWAEGFTGAGVVVAVLDTGIDAGHPDLAGKVLDAQSFIDDGLGTSDVVGHGTHVASIIAGTGAASGGQYRGVAPDAAVVSGRVCAGDGCPVSAILAGMEWAVVTKQAKIVNMSLGGPDSARVDPLEDAVNRLSAQYGALFVIAAGNSGALGAGSLDSPGSADAALAVGAVDRDDQLAAFSSRGPRIGDHAIKPDLTAPGVGIVAARAAIAGPDFGVPVGTAYTRLSGTSMATPHVAGAAAILLQRHAGWDGAQIKAALMESASPNPGLTVFEQGAGRVDVARATQQDVTAQPSSMSLGLAMWPHDDDPVITRTVTYRNDGAASITLAVSGSLGPQGAIAAGMLEISPASITVPAGGTAEVVVSVVTSGDRPDGIYTGALVAIAAGMRVVTLLSVEREGPAFDVTVGVLDRDGNPTGGMAELDGLDHPSEFRLLRPPATVRVPPGLYSLSVLPHEFMFLLYPRLEVSQPTTVVLDARLARPVAVGVPGQALETQWLEVDCHDLPHRGQDFYYFAPFSFPTGQFGPEAAPGELQSLALVTAVPEGSTDGRSIYLFGHRERDRLLTGWTATLADDQLATVHASHRGDAGRLYNKFAIGSLDDLPDQRGLPFTNAGYAAYQGSFDRTEHYFGDGVTWAPAMEQLHEVDGELQPETIAGYVVRRYLPGHSEVEHWNRAPFGPAFSDLEGIPVATRSGDTLSVAPSMFSEVSMPSRMGLSQGTLRAALYRDGQLVFGATSDGTSLFPAVDVPAARATYRLEHDATRPGELVELSPHVTGAWTFSSEHVPGSEPRALALPTLRFAPRLDDSNRAVRGAPLVLPVAIERPPGAATPAIARVSVDASFDDGETWSRVPGFQIGARWVGLVVHPATATYVSLRGSAGDVDGNRVEQTIIRAYKLAPADHDRSDRR